MMSKECIGVVTTFRTRRREKEEVQEGYCVAIADMSHRRFCMDVVLRPKRDIPQHGILLDYTQRLLIAINFFITDSSFPFPSPMTAGGGGAGRGGG
jgi:hypothetical protein